MNKRTAGVDRTFYLEAAKALKEKKDKHPHYERILKEHVRNYRRKLLKDWGWSA